MEKKSLNCASRLYRGGHIASDVVKADTYK